MSGDDDDFGLSSSDEAELGALADNLETPLKSFKRESTEQLSSQAKRQRDSETVSTQALAAATQVLRRHFGLQSFRLKQAQAISRLLQGQSCVVVFPTGGGKSLCYQVPALAFKELDKQSGIRQGVGESGLTVVVSPLIALMKDQVDALRRKGIGAAALDSTKTKDEYAATMDGIRNGTLDIVYCAPERLNNELFIDAMTRVRGGVRLLAIDEAHCISEWGHAFRPDYLKVARFAKEIRAERVACLTATATPLVAEDVCKQFEVSIEGLFRTPTYRPNLHLRADSFSTEDEKYLALVTFLRAHKGSTIVYITTQKSSEALAQRLRCDGFDAEHFHASVERQQKMDTQERFMASKDKIIVATIAFGMGIDKSDIRNVVHYVIPKSLEGYSQEVGRAGRDGKQSHCLAMLCGEDMHLLESFAIGDLPSPHSVAGLLRDIFSKKSKDDGTIEASLSWQERELDIKATVLKNIYAQLELRFHLLRETTPKYSSYQFLGLHGDPYDGSAASNAIQRTANRRTKWTFIDVDKAAGEVTRNQVVAKLRQWQDSGVIDLKQSGVVSVYRQMQPFPTTPAEQQQVVDQVYADLESREG